MIVGHAHPEVVAVAQEAGGARDGGRRTRARAARARRGARAARAERRARALRQLRQRGDDDRRAGRRALTGRPGVIKVSGGYHGSYPDLDVTLRPGFQPAGVPESTPTRTVPYNDPDALEAALGGLRRRMRLRDHGAGARRRRHRPRRPRLPRLRRGGCPCRGRAVRPRRGDLVPPERRRRPGLYGLKPDLTAFGKIIGGGFPVGAVGGRAEAMQVFAPGREPRLRPLRHVQRQPGHRRRRPQDAGAARRRGLREARPPGRGARRRAARRDRRDRRARARDAHRLPRQRALHARRAR